MSPLGPRSLDVFVAAQVVACISQLFFGTGLDNKLYDSLCSDSEATDEGVPAATVKLPTASVASAGPCCQERKDSTSKVSCVGEVSYRYGWAVLGAS